MSPLEEQDGDNMVEPALDANPPSRSPEADGNAVEELMGGVTGLSREENAKHKRILHQFSDVISIGDGDLRHTDVLYGTNLTQGMPLRHINQQEDFHLISVTWFRRCSKECFNRPGNCGTIRRSMGLTNHLDKKERCFLQVLY